MIKVSDYIMKRLNETYGVKCVFMVSGGGAMHLNDSVGKYVPYVCNHNEQASGICGEAYARYDGKLAVVSVTTGPGGLNALNGLFGAFTDSAPVLFISGQVKFSTCKASCPDVPLRQLGDQEVDIVSVVKPLTKYAEMITDPRKVKYCLDKAVFEATHGRKGPVWLDVPINVQAASVDEADLEDFAAPEKSAGDLKINEVVQKLSAAQRPLIVAGHGIRLSGQIETFRRLLDKLNVPVVTTFNGFDLMPDDDARYVGRIGTVGQRAGNFALQNADCVLFLGTRNNIRQASYNYENFAKRAFKIVVDIDRAELDKPTVRPDLPVCADLSDFLPALTAAVSRIDAADWMKWCLARKERFSFENTPEYQQTGGKINPYYAVRRLTELMPENTPFVMANGFACVGSFQAAVVKKGQRFLLNSGDASMGYDLPAAVGVCLSSGKKNTVCLAGDGSIMMNLQELQTIRHHRLPVKIFVVNNDGYLSIRQTQNNFFEGRHCGDGRTSGVSLPDFVKVGEAFGIKSLKLADVRAFDETVSGVLAANEPVLCEITVDPDVVFSPKLSARVLPDGSMVSPALEDMYPFLDRAEFERNMIG